MERPTGQREMMFCHECENEWYRDEHGLSCPSCHSDFCEVIEADHDPRADYMEEDDDDNASNPQPHTYVEYDHRIPDYVPDPGEDDIDHVRWMPNPNGDGFTMHGIFTNGRQNATRSNPVQNPGFSGQQPQDPRQLVFQNFTSMINGIMGGGTAAQMPPERAPASPPVVPPHPRQTNTHTHTQMRTMTFGLNNGRVFYSSNTTGGPGEGMQPRDPNNPNPENPVGDLHTVIGQMMAGMNAPRSPGTAGPPTSPFASLFNMFFNPAAAAHGDAVYTQEALDRVISQLMEQNSTGNAPGPANPTDIASLPKKKVDHSMLGDHGKTDCSICMDSVELGQEVTVLYCGHWFHEECIGMWLNSHDTCPHCRMGIKEAKEKKGGATPSSGAAASSTDQQSPESSSRRAAGRRTSSISMRRRRSSAQSSSAGQGGSNSNNTGSSNSGGILDRARNLFSRSSSNS